MMRSTITTLARTSAKTTTAVAAASSTASAAARRSYASPASSTAATSSSPSGLTAPRILVTGAGGQVGIDLVSELRTRYGAANIIATDIRRPEVASAVPGPFHHLDVCSRDDVMKSVVDNNVTQVVHLASMLSAVGEKNPQAAMLLNTRGIENVLEAARVHNLRVFAPSTIAVFGASTPRHQTPDETIMRPSTMYGVTKVYLELLGEYYKSKFGVDFRSVRYPGIISNSAMPGGGTTDYAVDIYHQALLAGKYECFLGEESEMPMMYAPDSTKAAVELLAAPKERLTQCTYNVTGFSFTPAQIAACIKQRIPSFEVSYKPDFRQQIANSWPASLDDSIARRDWGWQPSYTVERMTDDMLTVLRAKYGVYPGAEGRKAKEAAATSPVSPASQ